MFSFNKNLMILFSVSMYVTFLKEKNPYIGEMKQVHWPAVVHGPCVNM